jgi:hypothetical protein
MTMDISEEEQDVICHALDVYLSDLKTEIGKTENHDMKVGLQHERNVIENIIDRC